jgi:hypothetical protein
MKLKDMLQGHTIVKVDYDYGFGIFVKITLELDDGTVMTIAPCPDECIKVYTGTDFLTGDNVEG